VLSEVVEEVEDGLEDVEEEDVVEEDELLES